MKMLNLAWPLALMFVLMLTLTNASSAQEAATIQHQGITPETLFIQDNVERIIYDYTQTDEMGLIKMHAPPEWTEPIIEAQFEISGIVLQGSLGLEFEQGTQTIGLGQGFLIPQNTRVRIFNAGPDELILIEVLKPAYQPERVEQFERFER